MGWSWHPPLLVSSVAGGARGIWDLELKIIQRETQSNEGRQRGTRWEDVPFTKVLAPVLGVLASIPLSTPVLLTIIQNLHQVRGTIEPIMFTDLGSNLVSRMGEGGDDCPFLIGSRWLV